MNHVRGMLMLIAAGVAVWRGWKIPTSSHAWIGYGLAALAVSWLYGTCPVPLTRAGALCF
jgi:hypothetical protein